MPNLIQKTVFFAYIAMIFCQVSYAQNILVDTLSTKDGLIENNIRQILQDHHNYIWFKTPNGLSRYDGYSFKNYYQVTNGSIEKLFLDPSGRLWAHGARELNYYDETSNQFQAFPLPWLGFQERLQAISLDQRDSSFWYSSQEGIYKLRLSFEDEKSVSTPIIIDSLKVFEGKFWTRVLTPDQQGGVYFNHYNQLLHLKDGKLDTLMSFQPGVKRSLIGEIHVVGRDSILVRNHGFIKNGVPFSNTYLVQGKQKLMIIRSDDHHIKNIQYRANSISAIDDHGFYTLDLPSLIQWAKKGKNDIFRNEALLSGKHYPKTTFLPIHRLKPNKGLYTCWFRDKEENLWIGTYQSGLLLIKKHYFNFLARKHDFGKFGFFSLHNSRQGRQLLGASHNKIFEKTGPKEYRPIPLPSNGLQQGEFIDILETRNGAIWMLTGWNGFQRLYQDELITGKLERPSGQGNTHTLDLNSIHEDKQGNIWIIGEGGIFEMKVDQNQKKIYGFSPDSVLSKSTYAVDMLEDDYGSIWITTGSGLQLMENKQPQKYPKLLQTEKLTKIQRGINNEIWIATQNKGIFQLVLKRKHELALKNHFTVESHGLMTNIWTSLELDGEGNMWAASERGLVKFPYTNADPISYNYKDGLVNKPFSHVSLSFHQGNMELATAVGLVSFPTKKLQTEQKEIQLVLDAISINGVKKPFGFFDNKDKLELPYHQNNIRFEYVAPNFFNPQKVRYKYQLEGQDQEISPFTTERYSNYTSLKPGDYTFKVWVKNKDGIVSEEPLEFSFMIRKPWWQTTWFITAAILNGILLFLFIILWQRHRHAEKLEHERSKFQALALKMNPHFTFNTLNSIREYIEELQTQKASKAISYFAELMRKVLEASDHGLIKVHNEVEMLSDYLFLQQQGFEGNFSYSIELENKEEIEHLLLPNAMVQAFVENAILHGLKPKQGQKQLSIRFWANMEYLNIEVEDNGIGRQQAAANKLRNPSPHLSIALQSIARRLEMISRKSRKNASYFFEDIEDDKGKAIGTRLHLAIPVDLDPQQSYYPI